MTSRVLDDTTRVAAPLGGSRANENLRTLRELLSIRGFIQLCAGNGLALGALRLQSIAIAWLVLDMTGSRMWLGIVVGSPAVAVVGASLLGGVMADSPFARRTMQWTRIALAVSTALAGVLVTTGQVEIPFLIVLTLIAASMTALEMPIGRTLIFEMVGRQRVLQGTSMSSMAMNTCAVVGPIVVGLLIGRFGVDIALYAIAGVYVAAASLVPVAPQGDRPVRELNPLAELRAGFTYVRHTPCVAWLISLFFLVPVAGVFFAMVPVFARDVLDAGAGGLGAIMASWGAGTVVGSGYLVLNGQMRRRGPIVALLGVIFGAGMVAFAGSTSVVLSGAIAFGMGLTAMLWQNTLSAMVQTVATPEMKGRAMSIGTMGIQLVNLGWLVAGLGSAVFGPVPTLIAAGIAFGVLSLFVFARSQDVRAID